MRAAGATLGEDCGRVDSGLLRRERGDRKQLDCWQYRVEEVPCSLAACRRVLCSDIALLPVAHTDCFLDNYVRSTSTVVCSTAPAPGPTPPPVPPPSLSILALSSACPPAPQTSLPPPPSQ